MQDQVGLEMLQVALQRGPTSLGGDVADESVNAGDGTDGVEVDPDDEGLLRAVLLGDLEPSSGSGTQVDDDSGFGQEVVLSVQMYQFAARSNRRGSARLSYMVVDDDGECWAYKDERAR